MEPSVAIMGVEVQNIDYVSEINTLWKRYNEVIFLVDTYF